MDNLKEIRWKQRFENFDVWIYALSNRNLTIHTHDGELAKIHDKLSKEL